MAGRGHDPDKQDVYAADWQFRSVLDLANEVEDRTYNFHGHMMELPDERKFADLESIQMYYNRVCALDQVQREWPGIKAPTVRARRGEVYAHYSPLGAEVHVPVKGRWALREIVILHELAHHLEHDHHGPRFQGAWVYLMKVCMGDAAGLIFGEMLYNVVGKPFKARGLQRV
jgi:putative metallohydrolase (TIGR04338 family)